MAGTRTLLRPRSVIYSSLAPFLRIEYYEKNGNRLDTASGFGLAYACIFRGTMMKEIPSSKKSLSAAELLEAYFMGSVVAEMDRLVKAGATIEQADWFMKGALFGRTINDNSSSATIRANSSKKQHKLEKAEAAKPWPTTGIEWEEVRLDTMLAMFSRKTDSGNDK